MSSLAQDLASATSWAAERNLHLPRTVDTVYLGGGTPSLLAPQLLLRLFDAIRDQFAVSPDAEITVECAPGQIAPETLHALATAGVNRVSLGVQSFLDHEAHSSGRLHNRAMVLDDLRRLRAAGISNINLDLIAGLGGQTFASWDESLSVLLDSGVPHASIYMLEVDEDSRLGRELISGGARYSAALVPSDDAIARMYETAIERLHAAGLHQYEISNFSRPGFQSRHNLRYWQRRPYLGLGLDAASALYELAEPPGDGNTTIFNPDPLPVKNAAINLCLDPSKDGGESAPGVHPNLLRFTTTDKLLSYLDRSEPPETALLSPVRQLEEAWFLGLRLNAGVDPAALQLEFGPQAVAPALSVVESLIRDGLLERGDDRIRLTPQGRLLSNDVFQNFLDAVPHSPSRVPSP